MSDLGADARASGRRHTVQVVAALTALIGLAGLGVALSGLI